MNKKVYCKDCKFHKYFEYNCSYPNENKCTHPFSGVLIGNALEKWVEYKNIDKVNPNNDCKLYKHKPIGHDFFNFIKNVIWIFSL